MMGYLRTRNGRTTKTGRKAGLFLILLSLLVLMIIISIRAGYTDISLQDLLRILLGGGSDKENLILYEFRLPRIILAILVGIGFSLSGCILQGVTRNPMADPGLLGINSGAGIVVVLFMTLYGTLTKNATLALPFFSLLGALAVSALIYFLSNRRGFGLHPVRLVLNGVAIQSGINALMTVIILKLDSTQIDFIAVWQAGSIWNANWRLVASLLPWIILGGIYIAGKTRELDILGMGDTVAIGLGVTVERVKKHLLFVAVALAAASVTTSGSLHFIGLLGPHLARKLVGNRHRCLLPMCSLTGALLVLIADTVGRTVISPAEIPAGIVAAMIGAPYFIILMVGKGNGRPRRRA